MSLSSVNFDFSDAKVIYYATSDSGSKYTYSNNRTRLGWHVFRNESDGIRFELSFDNYEEGQIISFGDLDDIHDVDVILGYRCSFANINNSENHNNSSHSCDMHNSSGLTIVNGLGGDTFDINHSPDSYIDFNGRRYYKFPSPLIIERGNWNHYLYPSSHTDNESNTKIQTVTLLVAELSVSGWSKVSSLPSHRVKEWLCNDPPIAVDLIYNTCYVNHPRLLHDQVNTTSFRGRKLGDPLFDVIEELKKPDLILMQNIDLSYCEMNSDYHLPLLVDILSDDVKNNHIKSLDLSHNNFDSARFLFHVRLWIQNIRINICGNPVINRPSFSSWITSLAPEALNNLTWTIAVTVNGNGKKDE